jgi:hypothetical protein
MKFMKKFVIMMTMMIGHMAQNLLGDMNGEDINKSYL